MKKWKRFAALAAVILLLAVFCLPMIFALAGIGSGEFSQGLFQVSLFTVFFTVIMAYAIWLVYRLLDKKKNIEEGKAVIKNVIFDVGRVLVAFEWEEYLRKLGFSGEKYEKIAAATFAGPVWPERDRGLYDEEEYIRQFSQLAPEYEDEIPEVIRRSTETIHPYAYAETWVRYLKEQGYHLYILSNYSDYMLKDTIDRLTFLKYMDGAIFSCNVKMLKPEAEIYKALLEKYGLKPEECVFIDDVEENCESAEKQGIRSICFRDFKQAVSALEKMGVK